MLHAWLPDRVLVVVDDDANPTKYPNFMYIYLYKYLVGFMSDIYSTFPYAGIKPKPCNR